MTRSVFLLSFAALCACGPDAPPQIPGTTPSATASAEADVPKPEATSSAGPSCADAATCLDQGVAAYEGKGADKDLARAAELFVASCNLDGAQACFNLALMQHRGEGVPKDAAVARASFESACNLDHATGCSNVAIMTFKGEGGAIDQPAAIRLFERACNLGERDGCFNVGVGYLKGEGVEENQELALEWMKRSCKAGKSQGCAIAKEIEKERADPGGTTSPAATSATPVDGANLTMGETTVNDLKARDLSCRLDGGGAGLLASIAVLGGLAKKKPALEACVTKPAAPRIRWSFDQSGVSKVTVTAVDDAARPCIERAVTTMESAGSGECAATVLLKQ